MALLQFISGTTVSLLYDFFTTAGVRTNIDNPIGRIYTPQKEIYSQASLSQVSGVTGQYQQLFLVPTGATVGHWSTIGVGFTNNSNTFSSVQPFSIIDFAEEPMFIGVNDLRDYLAIPDTDHTKDELYKRILLTAVSLVEQYIRRRISIHQVQEVLHVKDASVLLLKDYPVTRITAMTVSSEFTGSTPSSPNTYTLVNASQDFYYKLNNDSGVMSLLDEVGSEYMYCGVYVEIDYEAGYMTVPESLRTAILMLASNIFNISQSEGLSVVRFGDLSFSFEKGLFNSKITDTLDTFRKVTLR